MRHVFQSAFYELLHGKSFADSLVRAIQRGGDTDTNGAIVGALLGKFFTIRLCLCYLRKYKYSCKLHLEVELGIKI